MNRERLIKALHSIRGARDTLEDAIETLEDMGVEDPDSAWSEDLVALTDALDETDTRLLMHARALHEIVQAEARKALR